MAKNEPIITFAGGEVTPHANERTDVDKYTSLCRHLDNFIPQIYGNVERRPGTKYLYEVIVPISG